MSTKSLKLAITVFDSNGYPAKGALQLVDSNLDSIQPIIEEYCERIYDRYISKITIDGLMTTVELKLCEEEDELTDLSNEIMGEYFKKSKSDIIAFGGINGDFENNLETDGEEYTVDLDFVDNLFESSKNVLDSRRISCPNSEVISEARYVHFADLIIAHLKEKYGLYDPFFELTREELEFEQEDGMIPLQIYDPDMDDADEEVKKAEMDDYYIPESYAKSIIDDPEFTVNTKELVDIPIIVKKFPGTS